MWPDLAHYDREPRELVDDAAQTAQGNAGAPFDPKGQSQGRLNDVLVSDLLKTRIALPPNLESENDCLQPRSTPLTDPEHALERSVRAAARCAARVPRV
jgi:hypothetical protein